MTVESIQANGIAPGRANIRQVIDGPFGTWAYSIWGRHMMLEQRSRLVQKGVAVRHNTFPLLCVEHGGMPEQTPLVLVSP